MKSNKNLKGFTLIELLVVIAIMAVLTGLIYVSISQTRGKSRDQQRIATIHLIQLGLEAYYNIHGSYPQALWSDQGSGTSSLQSLPNTSPGKIYAENLVPPSSDYSHGYFYVPLTPRGTNTGICNGYHLYTILESKTSVLESRAGYDSSNVRVCNGGDASLRRTASSSPLIYDVKSQ